MGNSKCNDKEEEEDAEGEAKQRSQSQQERVVGDAGVVEDEQQNQAKEKRMPRIAMKTMMMRKKKRVNNRLSKKKNRRRNLIDFDLGEIVTCLLCSFVHFGHGQILFTYAYNY